MRLIIKLFRIAVRGRSPKLDVRDTYAPLIEAIELDDAGIPSCRLGYLLPEHPIHSVADQSQANREIKLPISAILAA